MLYFRVFVCSFSGHQILKVHQIKGTVLIGVNFVGYSEKKSPKVSGVFLGGGGVGRGRGGIKTES
jgi:hypothetical protein